MGGGKLDLIHEVYIRFDFSDEPHGVAAPVRKTAVALASEEAVESAAALRLRVPVRRGDIARARPLEAVARSHVGVAGAEDEMLFGHWFSVLFCFVVVLL